MDYKGPICLEANTERLPLAVSFLEQLFAWSADVYISKALYEINPHIFNLFNGCWKIYQVEKEVENIPKIVITDKPLAGKEGTVLVFPILSAKQFSQNKTHHFEWSIPVKRHTSEWYYPHSKDALSWLELFLTKKVWKGQHILITAGPTVEDIDPVRFLSNRSTGKMGIALANMAKIYGAEVDLICGPVTQFIPSYITTESVRSAKEMFKAVKSKLRKDSIYISASAIADYTQPKVMGQKLKKGSGPLELKLDRTDDILKYVGQHKTAHQFIVGFSVETENLEINSRNKLQKKNLDLIIANNPKNKGAGFASDTNQVELITINKKISLPLVSKQETAFHILNQIRQMHNAR